MGGSACVWVCVCVFDYLWGWWCWGVGQHCCIHTHTHKLTSRPHAHHTTNHPYPPYPPTTGLPALHTVDLCANQLKRATSLAAVRFATATPSLQLLALDENEFPEDAVEGLQAAFAAAGRAGVLGSLEENMGDEEEEDNDELGHEVVDAAEEELAALLQQRL